MLLSRLGRCAAWRVKFPATHDYVRCLTNLLLTGKEERPLLMMLTVVTENYDLFPEP